MFEYTLHATQDPDGEKPLPGKDHMRTFSDSRDALVRAEVLATMHPEAFIMVQVERVEWPERGSWPREARITR